MRQPLLVDHEHLVYRVVRRGWRDPLDASFSQTRTSNRWNTPRFPALYACCSEPVARGVAQDVFRLSGITVEDLQPDARPSLVEIAWSGRVVDVASAAGLAAAGFGADYPVGTTADLTQAAAARWHREGREGVVCRSASLARTGFADWTGPHMRWGELAIFPDNARQPPRRRRTREDWLQPATA